MGVRFHWNTHLTDKRFGDAPFALTATASSGLPIRFSIVSFFFRKSFAGRSSDERIRQSMISLPTAWFGSGSHIRIND